MQERPNSNIEFTKDEIEIILEFFPKGICAFDLEMTGLSPLFDKISQFKNGVSFDTLVKQYTMDGNPSGILDWFLKGKMAPEFDKAVWHRPQGSIFTVDVPYKKWYYVVLKTDSNRTECAIDCISIDFDKS